MQGISSALKKAIGWIIPLEWLAQPRLWKMLAAPLMVVAFTGLTVYWPAKALYHSGVFPPIDTWYAGLRNRQLLIILLAATFPIGLYLRLLDNSADEPFAMQYSKAAFYMLLLWLLLLMMSARKGLVSPGGISAVIALFSAFCLYISPSEIGARIAKNRMALLIMCVAVLSPVIYIYYNWLIWRYTDMATSYLVRFIITQFGIETVAQFNWQSVVLASKTFRIHIYSPCSGVEGIAFTFYMISVFLLADWRFFSRCPYILEFYLVGFLFVFAVNATRIASIFLYGHWVHLYSIEDIDGRRKMVDIFHSNAGWLLYSIAISLFIMGMYALAARTSKAAKPEG